MSEIPLIAVAGPTASGKTGLAIDIARHIDGEIVSADSMQIYKYMDIGTAKPTKEERSAAVHHMIDFLEPDEEYSVADYTAAAHKIIADIYSRGKMPIMAGGTGLYINSVVNDVTFGEMNADYELRGELKKTAEQKGGEYLLRKLAEFDEVSAQRLHPNNLRRIIRAIEFYKVTGKPISEHQEETKRAKSRYNPLMLCIDWDREVLYDRINRRVDIMLAEGLIDEVKRLRDMGYNKSLNSMQGIGYKEVMDFLDGKMSLEETAELIKQSSRRYAKRQLTWFRRDERIHYVSSENPFGEAKILIDEFMKKTDAH
ncbi:MAG: tRNA (adenosine(37)-N6)-dimethylallyltransferase MiaA [Oscillospiraceae bacterium]|nr:tRNA (adenosine(37)-N6)-dimethylallyltransferase MiaA [Oscillospiraceae bacterium]